MNISKEHLKEIGKKEWKMIIDEGLITEGETILGVAKGVADPKPGQKTNGSARLILTNMKVIVFLPRMFGAYDFEEYQYPQITSLKKRKGMLTGAITFTVMGVRQKIGYIDNKKVDDFYKLFQGLLQTQKAQGMFCGNCGAPLTAGAKFCSSCGTPIS